LETLIMTEPLHVDAPNLEQDEPWSFAHTPNYARATPLESIDAASVTEEAFHRHYVMQNRPCVLRGAVSHWPACVKWRQPGYLKARSANVMMSARTEPMAQYIHAAHPSIRDHLLKRYEDTHHPMPLHDFLDQAQSAPRQLVLGSVDLSVQSPVGPLHEDLGDFPFLKTPPPSRMYPAHRAFIYRHSYTDWHYHATDEALMVQVVGTKEVLLLPPDQATWDALWPAVCQTGFLFGVDQARFPAFGTIAPIRVIVRPGDALYIPTYWWHAVASIDDQFGVTVAATFKTPLHINGDLRFPATRRFIKRYWRSRRAPMIAAALASALVRRVAGRG
jgi:hypothetical protein